MKILINDLEKNHKHYETIFQNYGYEINELIFRSSYEATKDFIAENLEKHGGHIDLIITNENQNDEINLLKANELLFFIKSLDSSFSNNNFRISSIPIILYSKNDSRINMLHGFNSIVKKNTVGDHTFFLKECERVIREWRKKIFTDLDVLGLKIKDLPNFVSSYYFRSSYQIISKNAINYFANRTEVFSIKFITVPTVLNYDWLMLKSTDIERSIYRYIDTYQNHQKYNRKNGERAILHEFFKKNKTILLRDTYSDMKYEMNLKEINTCNSEECDFILKTQYPDFLNTTFFEVKKEDVTFYVKKNTKRPQMSSAFLSHLKQVWGYKEFTENPVNQIELTTKLEYETKKFDFVLLAGRIDEKEEMKYLFENEVDRMFNGINVITYEELQVININYLEKFNRLSF